MGTMDVSSIFIDTNVLMHATDTLSPWRELAFATLRGVRQQQVDLVISPQILREYIAATTRGSQSGAGAPMSQVLENVKLFRTQFRVVEDSPLVLDNLLRILQTVTVAGKQIHDANIVATMQAYGIRQLLTHNTVDFARFARLITVIPLDAGSASL